MFCYSAAGATGSPVARTASTLPSATSCCAVTAFFGDGSTSGRQPRCSCAARRADNTTNSNVFIPSGRLTMMNLFVASAKEQEADTHADDDGRGYDDGKTVAKRPTVSGASREPRSPARVEIRIGCGLQWHRALTSARLR